MIYYFKTINLTRNEVMEGPTDLIDKTNKKTLHREAGDEVNTIYSFDSRIKCDELLSNKDTAKITNIIKAYIMMFGEEKLNEDLISDFIKKHTGKNVSFKIDRISKQYCHPVLETFPYYSEKIDLTNSLKKTINL